MEMGVDVSVPSHVCKHFQKQHEPRPVPVEEGSCRAWRLLQHPLQLPVTWEGMQRKLTLVSLASDSSPHCPEDGCSGLSCNLQSPFGWSQCCWLLSEGLRRGVHTAIPLWDVAGRDQPYLRNREEKED